MRVGSLFSGYGGLELGLAQVWDTELAWWCEKDLAARAVLAHAWPGVPGYRDVRGVDWASVDPIDVLCGGFPCQDVSRAGNGLGLAPGTRSGLWSFMAAAIEVLAPGLVVIENVQDLLSASAACDVGFCPGCVGARPGRPLRALGAVLGTLADLRYDAWWCTVRAADAGAPHRRSRVFVFAWPAGHPPVGAVEGDGGDRLAVAHRDGGPLVLDRAGGVVADPDGDGHGRGDERERVGGVAVRAGRGAPQQQRARGEPGPGGGGVGVEWGRYGPAVARWAALTRQVPPPCTASGALSPAFVEWMMGVPEGHVCAKAIGLSSAEQFRVLGNGVVPAQAALAARAFVAQAR